MEPLEFQSLVKLEKELIPIGLWLGEFDFREFSFLYPAIAVNLLELLGCHKYQEKDFFVEKFTCAWADKVPYYILVLHFPFEENRNYVGLAARAFVVYSQKLKKIHYFLDELTECLNKDGELYYRRKGRYYYLDDDEKGNAGISSYYVTLHTWESESFAHNMASYSWAAENKGVAGFLHLWNEN